MVSFCVNACKKKIAKCLGMWKNVVTLHKISVKQVLYFVVNAYILIG